MIWNVNLKLGHENAHHLIVYDQRFSATTKSVNFQMPNWSFFKTMWKLEWMKEKMSTTWLPKCNTDNPNTTMKICTNIKLIRKLNIYEIIYRLELKIFLEYLLKFIWLNIKQLSLIILDVIKKCHRVFSRYYLAWISVERPTEHQFLQSQLHVQHRSLNKKRFINSTYTFFIRNLELG